MRSVMDPVILNQMQVSPTVYMLAYNFSIKVPRAPLEVYANGVARGITQTYNSINFFDEAGLEQRQGHPTFMGEAGVAFVLMGGAVKVNFNALQSPVLRPNYYNQARNAKWFEYLSWSFDLKKLNPYDLVRELKF
jgi:hypothetical protein